MKGSWNSVNTSTNISVRKSRHKINEPFCARATEPQIRRRLEQSKAHPFRRCSGSALCGCTDPFQVRNDSQGVSKRQLWISTDFQPPSSPRGLPVFPLLRRTRQADPGQPDPGQTDPGQTGDGLFWVPTAFTTSSSEKQLTLHLDSHCICSGGMLSIAPSPAPRAPL